MLLEDAKATKDADDWRSKVQLFENHQIYHLEDDKTKAPDKTSADDSRPKFPLFEHHPNLPLT
jgi:hypothetical protein